MKPTKSYYDDLMRRLKDPEYAAAYLTACLEDEDEDEGGFLLALRDVADAYGGVRALAKKTGLNREHMFRMLSKSGNPNLNSLRQLVAAVGMKLVLQPA
jgi:probable addiction module antidote protein